VRFAFLQGHKMTLYSVLNLSTKLNVGLLRRLVLVTVKSFQIVSRFVTIVM
jgi:hypothetical protein